MSLTFDDGIIHIHIRVGIYGLKGILFGVPPISKPIRKETVAPSEEAKPTLGPWTGIEPLRLETLRTPKHAWFHCTTVTLIAVLKGSVNQSSMRQMCCNGGSGRCLAALLYLLQ
ncbi:hypothetical protein E2C01_041349 [Portunus trituberculatus]|uniref:Uncharacterized protein n=1 Tax=Portunus trituberculatus TaxID=210409 RepID=A0A5B7FRN8_PORTR|nr:hypothetical protein [Portunus trituberculatus]